MAHLEEKEFLFRLELKRAFGEDYDGEDDGFAWVPENRAMLQEMLAQLVATAARHGWQVRPANRGRSTEDEVTLIATKTD